VKLALALVAALSLAACVDEPTDPAASLSGIGPSKSFTTDPTQLVSKNFDQNAGFHGLDVQNVQVAFDNAIEVIDFSDVCTTDLECAVMGLRMNATEVLFYDANGKYLGLGHDPRK
jgi:hypothetical protein